jgi:hypothetical protein
LVSDAFGLIYLPSLFLLLWKISPITFSTRLHSASSKEELPSKIVQYLRGDKKEKLEALIQTGRVGIKFFEYDWSADGCNQLQFSKSYLRSFAPEMYRF